MPNGCSDDELPWSREADSRLDTKYPYGKHRNEYCNEPFQAFSLCTSEAHNRVCVCVCIHVCVFTSGFVDHDLLTSFARMPNLLFAVNC